ncbi:MAG: hypothetical protein H7249_02655 [Chitinophagaceae bacterium]|nr:hypothetical protein [Oligoflexus sp.]
MQNIMHAVLGMFSEQTQLRLVIDEQSRKLSFLQTKETFQQRVRTLFLENFEKHSQGEYEKPSKLSMYTVTTAVIGSLVAAASERLEYLVCPHFEAELVRLVLGYYRKI